MSSSIEMTRDRTALFEIAVTSQNGPVDLAGKSLAFAAKENLSDSAVLISKTSPSSGITISSPTSAGLAVLSIDPADTVALTDIQSHTLVWDVKLTDGAAEYGIAAGTLKVFGNVGV